MAEESQETTRLVFTDPYQSIIEICGMSQEIMDAKLRMSNILGEQTAKVQAISTNEPEKIWEVYSKQVNGAVVIKNKNFSGLCFHHAKLEGHIFEKCDFRKSRFIFTLTKGCKLTGSDFSNASFVASFPFSHSDCSGCNFSEMQCRFHFGLFDNNNFQDANFTNSFIVIPSSSVTDTSTEKSNFNNALMTGCKVEIEQEANHRISRDKVDSFLWKQFSPEQLALMQIDYGR